MKTKETNIDLISELVCFSSNFFIPTKKDGVSDVFGLCKKFQKSGDFKIFISQKNNQNIGYISLIINKTEGVLDIGPMFIDPKFSGCGFGKRQVQFIIDFANKNNYKKINTRTWGKNFASRKIFEILGFKETKEIKNDRVNNDSTVYYEKILK